MSARPAGVESVALANARLDLQTLEASNGAIDRSLQSRDFLYRCFMDRDGKLLASIYHSMIAPTIMARIAEYREMIARGDGIIQKADHVITTAQLQEVEQKLQSYQNLNNDDKSRSFRQLMLLAALYFEPTFRDFLIRQETPAHPFPQSDEAAVPIANTNAAAPPVLAPRELAGFIQKTLAPAFDALTSNQECVSVDFQVWITSLVAEYISQLPLDAHPK